ncbi:DUF308 domain-containing protein [Micromonospora lutea]|uniref:Thrombospondin n=1 Tax=Micromonospora lutea TaxID=419825 RepID=A0ABQ4IZB0_9ACTN|nr:DUF308 domain-containing protein [Micromonospora lutea]GIJ23273.1 hypothetical protein Vlu01_38970 [Micromonospora lutea]
MRFPSLSRREDPAPPADDARTGTVATDTRPDEPTAVEDRTAGSARRAPADDRIGADRATGTADRADHRADARRVAEARAATARSAVPGSRARTASTETADRTVDGRAVDGDRPGDADRSVGATETTDRTIEGDRVPDGAAGREVPPAPVGPRPRSSLLATLGLIVGVAGILFVLTGVLAGYGIALGAVGAVVAVLGLIATRRRHIAGKSDALLGIAFGLGAVVLGVLAMTGQYDWPTTDGDLVARFREWLDSQFVDRL